MRIVATGIDVIECERVAVVLARHGERFLERLLTDAERAYVRQKRNPLPHVAGRFAAKEAILKALGTGWRGGVAWRDMEILNDARGQPSAVLAGECARIAERLGIRQVLVSISHTSQLAIAMAVGVGE